MCAKSLLEYHQLERAEPLPPPVEADADRVAFRELSVLIDRLSQGYPELLPSAESRVAAFDLDVVCQVACGRYRCASPLVREHTRHGIGRDASWALVVYTRRCAALAERRRNSSLVEEGLVAHALAGLRHGDARDTIFALEELWRTCLAIIPPSPQQPFLVAASFAGPTMSSLLQGFLEAHGAGLK